ncbi:MAG TPA: amidohydrolase family protein [Opitutaceae bacterium]|nr:amidohydrolase family protein [Opitutaceae bacterium]
MAEPPSNPPPDPHPRVPRFRLPPGACDCHAHIFGPFDRFPVKNQDYLPALAPFDAYLGMHRTIGCSRGVLVQPSPYGTDNSAMVAALRSGRFPLRGIALIDEATTDRQLEELHWAGVQGCRIHLPADRAETILASLPRVVARIRRFGWHLQFYLFASRTPAVDRDLLALDIPIVIDHFGGLPAAEGTKSAGFECLLRLAASGRCWFKLSAPYRSSRQEPGFTDVIPLARGLVEAAPDRCVWGTDWPHPNASFMPNDGDLVDLLPLWVPDEANQRKVLVDNPARLYGF